MKPRVVVLLSGITLSAVLAAPIRPAAQQQRQQNDRAGKVGEGATNPAPFVNQPLVPDAVAPGGPEFTLTVNGTGFVSGSVVDWNGSALATTFVSGSQLTAIVAAADIASPSAASLTVVNPSPGGGRSNVVSFPITNATTSVSLSRADIATSSNFDLVSADFNGDGKPDLAVTSPQNANIDVLLGNGDGTFQPGVNYASGPLPGYITACDLNGDGAIDLVNTNGGYQTVSILLGKGDGTFGPHLDIPAGPEPEGVVCADFNRDGKLDLAVAEFSGSNSVAILLGNGDGTFQSPVYYKTAPGTSPNLITAADFNGDGKLDLAVTTDPITVSILLGNGDGTFGLYHDFEVGTYPGALVAVDFNGDSKLDLAVAPGYLSTGLVSILLGNGDGTFQPHVDYPTAINDSSLAAGDFNGDGKLDLATNGSSAISILFGNGDGTFQAHADYPIGAGGNVVTADFNGDGRLDFANTNVSADTVSILLQSTSVSLSASSLTFPTQLIGTTSKAQTVTLSNTGPIALTISSILASGDFLQTNTCGSSLPAGASCTISVSFKPTAKGTRTGTLTITDNAAGSPQTVSLTGTGTVVELSPSRLNFGSQKVGTTSPPQTVTVTNTGSTALNMTGVGITGTDFGEFADTTTCGSTLGHGQSCTITVTFTPQHTGMRHASANVGDNGGGSPQRVPLNGTGT